MTDDHEDVFKRLNETRRARKKDGNGKVLKFSQPPGPRPRIVIVAGETERIVNEIEAALIASGRPLFKRGDTIVTPGFSELPTGDKKTVVAQVIAERDPSAIVEDAEAVADFFRTKTASSTGVRCR